MLISRVIKILQNISVLEITKIFTQLDVLLKRKTKQSLKELNHLKHLFPHCAKEWTKFSKGITNTDLINNSNLVLLTLSD